MSLTPESAASQIGDIYRNLLAVRGKEYADTVQSINYLSQSIHRLLGSGCSYCSIISSHVTDASPEQLNALQSAHLIDHECASIAIGTYLFSLCRTLEKQFPGIGKDITMMVDITNHTIHSISVGGKDASSSE